MKLTVENAAVEWFKNEIDAKDGDSIRFVVRYGGSSPIQDGFSLGFFDEKPLDAGVFQTVNGINFFVEKEDFWYFNDYNLVVDSDPVTNELIYKYVN